MELYPNRYYHIYNRSNNNEVVFRSDDNYSYFLRKYHAAFHESLDTIAYCLMPTHFHFLVHVISDDTERIKHSLGKLQSSFTQSINRHYRRHGNLFQQHSKSKHIENEEYLKTLLTYIHQNPVRSKLVNKPEEWKYSSYCDYIGYRASILPKKVIGLKYFSTIEEFRSYSERGIEEIDARYWI
ncbi:MAG: transposase [Ignavibacteria bacterium]|nr:transposase [Ignavibacteria bacterium]